MHSNITMSSIENSASKITFNITTRCMNNTSESGVTKWYNSIYHYVCRYWQSLLNIIVMTAVQYLLVSMHTHTAYPPYFILLEYNIKMIYEFILKLF